MMPETDAGAGKWDGSGDSKADRIGSALMACLREWLKKGLQPGLHLVATPIGNLGDISPRALAAIATADRVYCEDTRTSRQLFTLSLIHI